MFEPFRNRGGGGRAWRERGKEVGPLGHPNYREGKPGARWEGRALLGGVCSRQEHNRNPCAHNRGQCSASPDPLYPPPHQPGFLEGPVVYRIGM